MCHFLPALRSTKCTSTHHGCEKPANAAMFQLRPTTQVPNIDRRLFEWRARRAKAAAGANVHIVNGEWRQPRHSGGPCTIRPADGEVTVFARKVVSFTSRVCKLKFDSKELGCVVSRCHGKQTSRFAPPSSQPNEGQLWGGQFLHVLKLTAHQASRCCENC